MRQGFTHYPQREESHRFFRGDLSLPRIIILLDGSGSLSFDVLSWLAEQGVALARIEWSGDAAVFASGAGFTANPQKLRWQYELQCDPAQRLAFSADLIARKMIGCIAALEQHFLASKAGDLAIGKARDAVDRLRTGTFTDMGEIRAIEGECAVAYFGAWSAIDMQWKAEARHPIPDQWRTYRSRSSTLTGRKPKNKNASNPVNAKLNYVYAVNAAQLQIQAVADGLDPYAGIMHHNREGFPAYVYDIIEPERPKVDAAVIGFVPSRKLSGADFILRKDRVCRLSPQLARAATALVTA